MSLKIWLPLNGDLHNQGASNINTTTVGGTVDSSGKIGSCYYLSSSSRIYTDLFTPDSNNFSMCCWYKAAEENTSSGYIFGLSRGTTPSFMLYRNSTTVFRLYIDSYSSYTHNLDLTQWHHLTITYDGTAYKLYIDGKYKAKRTKTIDYTIDSYRCFINCRSNNSNTNGAGAIYSGNNYYNDFRYYNHCLSAAEVREIAQGLILHYKLDSGLFGNKNILTNSSGQLGNATGWSGKTSASTMNGEPILITKRINTTSTSRTFCSHGNIQSLITDWIAGDDYTVSGWYYVPSNETQQTGANLFIRWTYTKTDGTVTTTDRGFTTPLTPTDQWIYFKYTWQVPTGHTSDQTANFYLAGFSAQKLATVYWKKVKLEKGNVATPWCPADSEMSINRTIIKDSSGYNHNGMIIGDLIPISDSQRYSMATKWNCSDPTTNNNTGLCYIQTPLTLTTPLQMSIVWWAKPESGYSGSHAAFCTSNLDTYPTDYNTTAFHHRDAGFDIYPSDGSGVKRLSFTYTKNEWHHYAITYDGTVARSYKDGVQQTSIEIGTNKTLASFTQLYIGFSKAGGIWRKTLGSYSDFRIYCTSLLDKDIKLLYNSSMRIDNLQNIHTFELNENKNKIAITRTGQLYCNELDEATAAKFHKNLIIETTEIIEY